MYNTFDAETLLMFPNRSEANTVFNVASHLQKLVKDNVTTFADLYEMPYKFIFLEYLPQCDAYTLCEAFKLLKGLQNAN